MDQLDLLEAEPTQTPVMQSPQSAPRQTRGDAPPPTTAPLQSSAAVHTTAPLHAAAAHSSAVAPHAAAQPKTQHESAPVSSAAPRKFAADRDDVLTEILEELRSIRRERQHEDFSIGRMAGAIIQAFAVCAMGWGLFAAANLEWNEATIRLLAGIALQLMALTCFTAGRRN